MRKLINNSKDGSIYDQAIEPVIEEMAKKHGMASEVHRQYCKLSGQTLSIQSVQVWLRADRRERVEPSYSRATVLFRAIIAARDIMAKAHNSN